MFDLDQMLAGVQALLKEVTNIVGLIDKNVASIYRLKNRIRRQRELQKLRRVLFDLNMLAHQQLQLPDIMESVANLLDGKLVGYEANYVQRQYEYDLEQAFGQVLENVVACREFLEHERPEFLERQPEIYDRIKEALYKREQLVSKRTRYRQASKALLKKSDAAKLRTLATEYRSLIENMSGYRDRLAKYVDRKDR
jgi:hypothetical protein